MNVDDILRMLQNSGIRVIGINGKSIAIEDPSCILRGFDAFLEYAWIAIILVTMLMLSGWAVSLLRGAKNDIFTNMRNLILMFAALSAVGPIMVGIWGHDYIAKGCKTVEIPISNVQSILDMRNNKLATHNPDDIWEEIEIFDSGATITETVSETPDAPQETGGASDQTSGDSSQDQTSSNTTNSAPNNGNIPHRATTSGRDVIYEYLNGSHIRRTGGSPAWRNNNQGNIVYGKFAQSMGALTKNGRFAVFPSADHGMTAIKSLLRSKSYNNLSIANAISRWAPPSENDTAGYQRQLAKLTNLDINRTVSSLNDAELDSVANAIKKVEGYIVGREIKE